MSEVAVDGPLRPRGGPFVGGDQFSNFSPFVLPNFGRPPRRTCCFRTGRDPEELRYYSFLSGRPMFLDRPTENAIKFKMESASPLSRTAGA